MHDDLEKLSIPNVYAPPRVVEAYQCPSCDVLHYPATLRCRSCGCRRYPEDEVELIWHKRGYVSWKRVPLEGPCTLVTWTRLWALPEGYEGPWVDLCVVRFPNGVSALAHLEADEPKAGMGLTAGVRHLRDIDGEPFHGLVASDHP